jgi:hypothetical protein
MALVVAENEPRIKGCVAFAPVVDMTQRIPAELQSQLAQVVPGAEAFFTRYNPSQHEDTINCPVFLFHALDDSNVPVSQSQDCQRRLAQLGKKVTLRLVPTGDHYDSMITKGVASAIGWLREQAGMEPLAANPDGTPRPQVRAPRLPVRAPQGPQGIRPPMPGINRPRPGMNRPPRPGMNRPGPRFGPGRP